MTTGGTSMRTGSCAPAMSEPLTNRWRRAGAALRVAASGSRSPSAVDAIVVAMADAVGGAAVLTTDPRDLRTLARYAAHDVRISSV